MANRIVLLVSVALAGVALAATSTSAAPAADECLAKPQTQVLPAGKHWYFRTNRATQRKCWYLANEGATIVAVAAPKPPVAATPVDPAQKTGVQSPTTNARAELIDEPRVEQPAMLATLPQPQALQSTPDGVNTRNWVVASRWPDQANAFVSHPATMVNDPTPVSQQAGNPTPVLDAGPVLSAEQPPVAADNADTVSFAQFAAVLVLAIVGGAIFMMFVFRRLDRRHSSSQRRAPRTVMRGDDMPWTRSSGATATRPATAVRIPERNSLSEEIEEMEQLLAIARQARGS